MTPQIAQQLLALLKAIDTDEKDSPRGWIEEVCSARESLPKETMDELQAIINYLPASAKFS